MLLLNFKTVKFIYGLTLDYLKRNVVSYKVTLRGRFLRKRLTLNGLTKNYIILNISIFFFGNKYDKPMEVGQHRVAKHLLLVLKLAITQKQGGSMDRQVNAFDKPHIFCSEVEFLECGKKSISKGFLVL